MICEHLICQGNMPRPTTLDMGPGLIPSSAPMVEEVAGFWRKYYGIKG